MQNEATSAINGLADIGNVRSQTKISTMLQLRQEGVYYETRPKRRPDSFHASTQPCRKLTLVCYRCDVTQREYWRIFDAVRGDLDAAIKSNTAYLKIHALAAGDYDILGKYNRFAGFWNLCTFALQTTFFISLSRLFDNRRDSVSIHKLANATVDNCSFFSKAALRERKHELSHTSNTDPPWLSDFVNKAWHPKAGDLAFIKAALTPRAAVSACTC